MTVSVNVVLLFRCFGVWFAVGWSRFLLSYTSKWSRDVEEHCVGYCNLFQAFFGILFYTCFFQKNFLLHLFTFFYIIKILIFSWHFNYYFLWILLTTWRCVQLYSFGCFCQTRTRSIEMKGTKWSTFTANVMGSGITKLCRFLIVITHCCSTSVCTWTTLNFVYFLHLLTEFVDLINR